MCDVCSQIRVMSGASGGSIPVAMCATRTEQQLLDDVRVRECIPCVRPHTPRQCVGMLDHVFLLCADE